MSKMFEAAINDIQALIDERAKDTSPACATWNNKHLVDAIRLLGAAQAVDKKKALPLVDRIVRELAVAEREFNSLPRVCIMARIDTLDGPVLVQIRALLKALLDEKEE